MVVQGNKTGFLYILDRETGAPVFGVEERPVPPSDVAGEVASATQPIPVAPPPIARQRLSADDTWGITAEERDTCRVALTNLRNEGIFTPPSTRGSLIVPGNVGGMNWSGYAFDPSRGVLVVNTNDLPAIARLIPREKFAEEARAEVDRLLQLAAWSLLRARSMRVCAPSTLRTAENSGRVSCQLMETRRR